jgi:RNA polymerase-binding transcription factor
VDVERARALPAERREIEQVLSRRGLQEDDGDTGWLKPVSLAAALYLDELEGRVDELRRRLAALEHAQQHLAAGTYGLSIRSDEPISDGRLEALPIAERTVEEEPIVAEGRPK